MTRRQKALSIERGELEDDYNNHFLSHFGFYDENTSDYGRLSKYYKNDITGFSESNL
jgi:hypothetical protein